jgi:heptosyltransferase-1
MHAVERTRLLFARSLGYPLPNTFGEYGIDAAVPAAAGDLPRGLLFFHGTARAEKLWPQSQWMALVKLAEDAGYRVWLPWGNDEELQRARQIAGGGSNTEVLPRMNLRELAGLLQSVKGAVAIDTGLGHLAAALAVPTVSLYGPTRTSLVGAYGRNQVHLQSPVVDDDITDPLTLMQAITATTVWQALVAAIEGVA